MPTSDTLVIEQGPEERALLVEHGMRIKDDGARCLYLCALLGDTLLGKDILAISEGRGGKPVFRLDDDGLLRVDFVKEGGA